ncbi:MAG: class I SAM-dependent methyltransferase [Bacteroidales bacterium]|jgi:caffeoyl-CoA O-methyltransferase|nr:class I SAM-dependent methyltransferase [Bacteroidales bacterium]
MKEKQIYPFLDERIENYCNEHLSEEPQHLREISRKTFLKYVKPQMISGNWQGGFLRLISKIAKPKKILEIGTFTGYATLSLADGLQEGGKIYTIEKDEIYRDFLEEMINKYGYSSMVELIFGDALDIIPSLNEDFDIIFIDANKAKYPQYYKMCINKLNLGGLIIADNILWYGKVGLEIMPNDKQTAAIDEFNKLITEDSNVENLIIPIRDGLMIGRKIK